MTTPYYQDEQVTLWYGDSLEVLPTLDVEAHVLLTDPPYFKVKQDEWDNQWKKAHHFLTWLGDFLDLAKPLVAANGSVWVFASPAMTTAVERLVSERFRVLNSIRWSKALSTTSNRMSLPALRSFLPKWEGIIFAEQYADQYGDAAKALRREVFAPFGDYLRSERERAGWSQDEVMVALGYVLKTDETRGTVLCLQWERGNSLPTHDAYTRYRALLNRAPGNYLRREYEDLRREYEDLRREYEDLRREYINLRRPFSVTEYALAGDIWDFPATPRNQARHPTEKPEAMLRHMIEVSSRPGDLILDPFAGSGSTLTAARSTGRQAIGIERDERYCEQIAQRLTQTSFNFGGL